MVDEDLCEDHLFSMSPIGCTNCGWNRVKAAIEGAIPKINEQRQFMEWCGARDTPGVGVFAHDGIQEWLTFYIESHEPSRSRSDDRPRNRP